MRLTTTYVDGYIRTGEYERAPERVEPQPYGRVVVLHLTVLFGGWIVLLSGSPLLALLLIVIKTGADVRAHQAERRTFATSA